MIQLYVCPVCGNVTDEAYCGDCLLERLKLVELVRVKVTDCPGMMVPDLSNVVPLRRPQR
jgi:hypothetical protein